MNRSRGLALALSAPALFLWVSATGALPVAQTPASPEKAAGQAASSGAAEKPAKPVEQPEATKPAEQVPPKVPSPKGKLLRSQWFLLSYESSKIGYENKALYQTDGPEPIAYRLEIHRFLKTFADETRPGYLENTTMEMDKDWSAVAFKTTRRGIGVKTGEVEGRVVEGKLKLVIASGANRQDFSIPIEGRPTFNGAFVDWLSGQPLVVDKVLSRSTIDERDGAFSAAPRVARVLQQSTVMQGKRSEDVFVVRDQAGLAILGHLLHPGGPLYRSEGQNHNLVAQEMPGEQITQLDLSGKTEWQNRVEGKTGDALACEAYGYKAVLPPYPYVAVSAGEGRFLALKNLMGNDGLHLIAAAIPADDKDAPKKLYKQWTALVGEASDVVESKLTVADLPALLFEGQIKIGGLPARFSMAAVAREHIGYVIGYLRLAPEPAGDSVFRSFLSGLAWTKIFGRERGHWDGLEYASDSYGYRVRLLEAGWRVPQERSGVATSIEAVRDDRSALVAVLIQPTEGTTLEDAAVAYEKQIKEKLPQAANLKRQEAKLGGRPATTISYESKAIDNEPTESRHVLTLDAGRLVILTLVSKKTTVDANLKHFAAVLESFKFTPAPQVQEAPK